MQRLIKIKDVVHRVPVSRAQIYNMIAAGKFPPPIHLGGRGSFWLDQEIDNWILAQAKTPVSSNPESVAEPSSSIPDSAAKLAA
jgi:prophage regulatory protein